MPQPRASRALGRGLLALTKPRPVESTRLDGALVKPRGEPEPLPVPPYMQWKDFHPWFDREWKAGDHVSAVGMTKSGKTTLARNVIKARDFVVVLGTKPRDDSLYEPLEAEGFVRRENWTPWDWEDTGERYVIFAPPLELSQHPEPGEVTKALAKQADAFRTALVQIFQAGGWCIYADEVRYLTDDLKLEPIMNLLWLQGRSNGITIFASTQRPRSVPLNTFEQATWSFLWRISDREDRRRASEMTGALAPIVFETAGKLPRNEFLLVDKVDDRIVRSRVVL